MDIDRRRLLTLVATTGAALPFAAQALSPSPKSKFASLLSGFDPQASQRIARHWLATVPEPGALLSKVTAFREKVLRVSQSDQPTIEEWIQSESRADFESGRFHDVGGWMLSETELSLCLLCHLEKQV